MTAPAPFRYLFGPVPSRRLGRSLGVDLTPGKICTENCIFCQIGRTTVLTAERREWVPTADVVEEMKRWREGGGKADYVTLSGSGEPTLHTHFGQIIRLAKTWEGVRTALLSNGSLLWQSDVRRDAAAADVVKVTVSAWDESSFQKIHRPAPEITFERLRAGIRAFRKEYSGELWVEVMIMPGANDAPDQIRAIAAIVGEIRPDKIHLNTIIRPPGTGISLAPVPEAWLRTVAPWFSPPAEIPVFRGRMKAPADMDDAELLSLLARHPLALEALAASSGVSVHAVEQRLEPLKIAQKILIEDQQGIKMARTVGL